MFKKITDVCPTNKSKATNKACEKYSVIFNINGSGTYTDWPKKYIYAPFLRHFLWLPFIWLALCFERISHYTRYIILPFKFWLLILYRRISGFVRLSEAECWWKKYCLFRFLRQNSSYPIPCLGTLRSQVECWQCFHLGQPNPPHGLRWTIRYRTGNSDKCMEWNLESYQRLRFLVMILIATGGENLKVTKLSFWVSLKRLHGNGLHSQQEKRTWFHSLIKGLKV
jgi:hypothetical protein